MREDSLRSHKRQHSEYGDGKGADVTVLQFQVDAGKPPAAPLAVGHLQVPLPPTPAPQFSEGRVKIIVGHQVPQASTIVQAAAAAVNIVQPTLVAPNPEELRGNSRLQILRQVNLIAPPPPSGCPSEAAALPQPAVPAPPQPHCLLPVCQQLGLRCSVLGLCRCMADRGGAICCCFKQRVEGRLPREAVYFC